MLKAVSTFWEVKGSGCVRCVRKVFEKSEGQKPFWERKNQGFELFQQSIILILYLKFVICLIKVWKAKTVFVKR